MHLMSPHLCVKLQKPPRKRPKPSFFSNSMYFGWCARTTFSRQQAKNFNTLPLLALLRTAALTADFSFFKKKRNHTDIHNVPFTWGASATTRSCCLSKSTSKLISVPDRKELKKLTEQNFLTSSSNLASVLMGSIHSKKEVFSSESWKKGLIHTSNPLPFPETRCWQLLKEMQHLFFDSNLLKFQLRFC